MTVSPVSKVRPSLSEVLATHRAIVCVGTGGVGKTTLAAALALAGAMQGRRAMVLTIDPARQLARALGLQGLRWGGEPVDLSALQSSGLPLSSGELHAGMLDQKAAWDDFITRHAPDPQVRDSILGNRFYQQLSTVMAGSTEYMAIEELCRLDESDRYDLIVVDTPPAGYAVDFLRAPDRLERLLHPEVLQWFSRRYVTMGRGAFRAVSASVRYAVRHLERAAGTRTLREISAFFVAFNALFGDIAARMVRARAILQSPETAFALVVGPGERVLAQGDSLMDSIHAFEVPLRAVVANRVHPLTDAERTRPELPEHIFTDLATEGVDAEVLSWLRATWQQAVLTDKTEQERLQRFAEAVPATAAWAEVAELSHDAHSLLDLAQVALRMGALPLPSEAT
jgi:anion-transporting  ArsA/GET3 family ATPase